MGPALQVKRAYEPASPRDGSRVLVERLWPRGVRKSELKLDEWSKDVAPSAELRKWFAHDPARFREFSSRYRRELKRAPAKQALADLVRRASEGPLTLVYGARDEEHNGAVVLREVIAEALRRS
jgi:uncharacterized protein YeaO (DUF488 family)